MRTSDPVSARSRQAALTLVILLAVASLLWGAEPQAIKVSVLAILASDRNKNIAPELKNIAEEIQQLNPNLTSFRVTRMICKSIKIGASDTFDLGNDQIATVAIDGKDAQGCVQLHVTPPLMNKITYSTTCGKFLPFVTRYETKKKELLIFAVRVQPCPGKK